MFIFESQFRSIFRTLSNIQDGGFWANIKGLLLFDYFLKDYFFDGLFGENMVFFQYFFKKMNAIYYFFWISNFVIYAWFLLTQNKNIREPELGNMSITSEMMTTAGDLAGKFMVLIPETIKMRVFWKKWKNVIVTWVVYWIQSKWNCSCSLHW